MFVGWMEEGGGGLSTRPESNSGEPKTITFLDKPFRKLVLQLSSSRAATVCSTQTHNQTKTNILFCCGNRGNISVLHSAVGQQVKSCRSEHFNIDQSWKRLYRASEKEGGREEGVRQRYSNNREQGERGAGGGGGGGREKWWWLSQGEAVSQPSTCQ